MSETNTPGESTSREPRKPSDGETENPFEDADLDISDFGENPDTETAG